MNGTESPESQKPPPSSAGTNGHASTNSSLAAKKRKKDGLKPIITMEGVGPHPAIGYVQRFVSSRLVVYCCHPLYFLLACIALTTRHIVSS
jgi:hypothetical protein